MKSKKVWKWQVNELIKLKTKNLDPMQKLAMNPPSEALIQQAPREWGIYVEPIFYK